MITHLACPRHFGFWKQRPELLAYNMGDQAGSSVLECEDECGYWTIVSAATLAQLTNGRAAA